MLKADGRVSRNHLRMLWGSTAALLVKNQVNKPLSNGITGWMNILCKELGWKRFYQLQSYFYMNSSGFKIIKGSCKRVISEHTDFASPSAIGIYFEKWIMGKRDNDSSTSFSGARTPGRCKRHRWRSYDESIMINLSWEGRDICTCEVHTVS